MELSTAIQMEGVLRQQESGTSTPVAKKTRSAAQQKLNGNKLETANENVLGDDTFDAPPKTPSASVRPLTETPRRSSRKSVRPPLDYADIIEKHGTCSTTKEEREKEELEQVPEEDHAAQKWTAAEVGRHSRKRSRSRKVKRAANKKAKTEEEDQMIAEEEDEEQEKLQRQGQDKAKRAANKKAKAEKECSDLETMEEEQAEAAAKEEEKEIKQEEIAAADSHQNQGSANKIAKASIMQKEDQGEAAAAEEKGAREKEQQQLATAEAAAVEPQTQGQDNAEPELHDEVKDETFEAATDEQELNLKLCSPVVEDAVPAPETVVTAKSQQTALAIDADMDELGLSPLEAEEHIIEDDEMPSLIMLDDGESENVMNLTFDADENASDEENMPALCVTEQQLQLDEDFDVEVDIKNRSSGEHKAKAYRFPTPHKCKSTPRYKFADTTATETSIQNLEVPCVGRRKRSKSVSGLNETKAKTVSFFSPIEVAIVNDIDKRWEGLNNSHVTQRRKRSKSLDESRHQISRIPKPKPYLPVKAVLTPSKQKARTKLPNFAAIHQKQFEKMENLVDHMERKAVRAKVLTNSAVKLQKQQQATLAAAQKASAKKTPAAELARPRALKKIAVPSYTLTPMKPDQVMRQKLLPTPRKIVAVAQPKSVAPTRTLLAANNPRPAFSLSTSVVAKMFIPAASAPTGSRGNKQEETMKSKSETRRQRHMEMFKGRTAKEQRGDLIRGVRSNRRFELQMQHRRQLDENAG